uniref:Uncharacterized protein n=1 Tax=Arundo donax TaxID=35708 RepID=A0A0A9DCA8_ARUDO
MHCYLGEIELKRPYLSTFIDNVALSITFPLLQYVPCFVNVLCAMLISNSDIHNIFFNLYQHYNAKHCGNPAAKCCYTLFATLV